MYGNYHPFQNAKRLIEKEVNKSTKKFFLLGLGYGYHLKALIDCIGLLDEKFITVYALDEYEFELYKNSSVYSILKDVQNVKVTSKINELNVDEETQLILPQAWVQAIEPENPLYLFLHDIKMKQRSFREASEIMERNFYSNIIYKEFNLIQYKGSLEKCKVACLVSSGPSLQETYSYLLKNRENLFIICVGSALRALLYWEIIPDAVIIVDPHKITMEQFQNVDFQGDLFYLSTSYYETTRMLNGDRCILLQKGYSLSEQLAEQIGYPLFETGGSVATTGFCLLEFLGFNQIVLFGQDLGFKGRSSHFLGSTSGVTYESTDKLLSVKANSDIEIYTEKGLYAFLKWFEHKARNTQIALYNTALDGAKIDGVPYITEEEFNQIINLTIK
ncbi:DUF115 domain-containing protein [Metasolibacillus meyeri]|uniref:DUF115 domain-containing protein n=1 Tax=Metasolibacillus meyeri TaxID=1071052 RepID=A0AAW9NVB6_9BACL|nr:6-hydroxymethylpterin diphosphokinase MptE-like protein [Metasolibacillus meyeri]MEC1178871.1 DUF115 domain-containing protein [Metasolibacillus meyeri]